MFWEFPIKLYVCSSCDPAMLLKYIPQRNENIHTLKDLYVNDYCTLIHIHPQLEITQIWNNRRM